jgi:hypothetical protein
MDALVRSFVRPRSPRCIVALLALVTRVGRPRQPEARPKPEEQGDSTRRTLWQHA